MSIRTIVLNVHPVGSPEGAFALALNLAERLGAGVVGFSAHQVLGLALSEASGLLIKQEIDAARQRFHELGALFKAAIPDARRLDWRTGHGPVAPLLAAEARLGDLVVIASHQAASDPTVDVGTLVLSAGRPVLVAAAGARALAPGRIMVAWKDTREARRAIRDALPFLGLAHEVVVVQCGPYDRDDRTGQDVLAFLERHGVSGRLEQLSDREFTEDTVIVRFAETMKADLVVSGAFGHSRLREWAFGGVTRSLINAGHLNRLLSN